MDICSRWLSEFGRIHARNARRTAMIAAPRLASWGAAGPAPSGIIVAHGSPRYASVFGPSIGLRQVRHASRDD